MFQMMTKIAQLITRHVHFVMLLKKQLIKESQ